MEKTLFYQQRKAMRAKQTKLKHMGSTSVKRTVLREDQSLMKVNIIMLLKACHPT